MNYRQVTLERGTRSKVAWIPAKFAVEGKSLRIAGEEGWIVLAVGMLMNEDFVMQRRDDYRYQRRVSDD